MEEDVTGEENGYCSLVFGSNELEICLDTVELRRRDIVSVEVVQDVYKWEESAWVRRGGLARYVHMIIRMGSTVRSILRTVFFSNARRSSWLRATIEAGARSSAATLRIGTG